VRLRIRGLSILGWRAASSMRTDLVLDALPHRTGGTPRRGVQQASIRYNEPTAEACGASTTLRRTPSSRSPGTTTGALMAPAAISPRPEYEQVHYRQHPVLAEALV
jgi:hypothetical protein